MKRNCVRMLNSIVLASCLLMAPKIWADHFEGWVWYDTDCNGVLDAGETAVSNVLVEVRNCSDNSLVASNLTDGSGNFIFTTLDVAYGGTYHVCCTGLPSGYGFAPQIYPPPASGIVSTVDPATGCAPCFTFTNSTGNINNAGLCQSVCSGVIGDFVWNDLNGNGCEDPGEPGIAGVRVDLYADCAPNPVAFIKSVTTDAEGLYRFTDLCAGNYTVSFSTPTGFVRTLAKQSCNVSELPSTETDSDCDCPDGVPCSVCVNLATSSSSDLSIDCGYVAVIPPGTLSSGDTATIGFWHNKNGQALILALNGGGSSTKLGDWLAANFPCLYGNLAGKQNKVVAAQFLTYFNVKGQKTYAQVLAGALASYATSSTLAGGNMAAKYGFHVSAAGTGAKTYNVGSNGTVLGLANNATYTVLQLLQAANAKCPWNTAVFNALNVIFDGINQTGDIS